MRRSIAVAATLTSVFAACGGGDDGGFDSAGGACDAFVAVERAFVVDEDPEAGAAALHDFVDAAPADVSAAVRPLLDRFLEDGAGALESAAAVPAETAADAYALGHCADATVDLHADEFTLSGAPSELDAGRIAFRLTNATREGEAHEALLLRKKDGIAGSPHDALAKALGETISASDTLAAFEQFGFAGGGFVEPEGDTEDVFVVDAEPGEYVLVCLLPVGTGANLDAYFRGDDVDAPRHFDRGMFAEISVR